MSARRRPGRWLAGATLIAAAAVATEVAGQRGGAFRASRDHPAIRYTDGSVDDAVAALNRRLAAGEVDLTFEGRGGYLRSVLGALAVPVESQVAVFSPTSNQDDLITSDNPRAIFFNDSVAVGWVRDAELLEVAAQDPRQGVIFYAIPQTPGGEPRFTRNDRCLACHLSWDTLGVARAAGAEHGAALRPIRMPTRRVSSPTTEAAWSTAGAGGTSPGRTAGRRTWGTSRSSTCRTRTPRSASFRTVLDSLAERIDLDGYPSPYSDVVALLVLDHQTHMTNLLTRMGWEARRVVFRDEGRSTDDPRFAEVIREAAVELVDYLLFVDEAPLPEGISGASGFREWFSARGPHDDRGRSLREISLDGRLFRYPCSYMIYTEAFDALPELAQEAVYARMWEVLSGGVTESPYDRLALADRRAIVEILQATKQDLPPYFGTVER